MRMLQRIAKTEKPIKDTAKKVAHGYRTVAECEIPYKPVYSKGEKYITEDDITNLRIELETCKDVQEFIDHL